MKRDYSDSLLATVLDSYWVIKEDNEIPAELMVTTQQRGERAPFESAAILLADVDQGLEALLPGRWLPICQELILDDFYTDITRTHKSKLIYQLSFYQQAIARYHWLKEQDELQNAARARKLMLRFLNTGIRPLKDPQMAELGRHGGLARANKQTPQERENLARVAARARWDANA